MPHQTLTEELHPVGTQQLRQRTHLCDNAEIAENRIEAKNVHFCNLLRIHREFVSVGVCLYQICPSIPQR